MAPRYYRVSPRFWSDTKDWSDGAKTLALYILTSPHRSLEGLFRLPKAYITADLGWSLERLSKPFGELLANGFIHYDEATEIVLITNALKYQSPDNPNQVKHALTILEELPPTPLFALLTTVAKRFCEPLAEGLQEQLGEGFGKPPALTPTQAPPPATSPSLSRDARARAINEEWKPTKELIEWAISEYPDLDIVLETQKFKDHFAANGKPMKSWEAAWRNWLRRSPDFAPRPIQQGFANAGRGS